MPQKLLNCARVITAEDGYTNLKAAASRSTAEATASANDAEQYRKLLEDLTRSSAEAKERYARDIDVKSRLVQLHQDASRDESCQCEKLRVLVQSLRDAAQQREEKHGAEMRASKQANAFSLGAAHQRIAELETALNNETKGSCQSSNLSEEPRPGSLTHWYGHVVAAEEVLASESPKREEAEGQLHRILSEIERKAPAIASQRRDYERALRAHNTVRVGSWTRQCVKRLELLLNYHHRLLNRQN